MLNVTARPGVTKMFLHTILFDFQINVHSTSTMKTLDDLRPFTSYTCTIHAVTVSDGPLSNPLTVMTAEQGTYIS